MPTEITVYLLNLGNKILRCLKLCTALPPCCILCLFQAPPHLLFTQVTFLNPNIHILKGEMSGVTQVQQQQRLYEIDSMFFVRGMFLPFTAVT